MGVKVNVKREAARRPPGEVGLGFLETCAELLSRIALIAVLCGWAASSSSRSLTISDRGVNLAGHQTNQYA